MQSGQTRCTHTDRHTHERRSFGGCIVRQGCTRVFLCGACVRSRTDYLTDRDRTLDVQELANALTEMRILVLGY